MYDVTLTSAAFFGNTHNVIKYRYTQLIFRPLSGKISQEQTFSRCQFILPIVIKTTVQVVFCNSVDFLSNYSIQVKYYFLIYK
jgi:hypothetical protein